MRKPRLRKSTVIPHPAMKVKKQNKVVENQLEQTLNHFEHKSKVQSERLEQSIRNLQKQIEHLEHEKERTIVPRKSIGDFFGGRLSVTPDTPKRERRRAFSCDFGTPGRDRGKRHICRYFPCVLPTSYHTIGFRLDPSNTEWIPWKKLRNDLHDVTMSAINSSTLMNAGVSRLRAERREELLKMEMESRRKRVEEGKPPSWATNYGKPVSIRRLKYPVRLDPLH
ncbi:hypothetical protein FSP39_012871 [Pinctada imbricata]|uniref:Uncharacterized protein n=1 Tax=Pinctada imbricata TaxID=66713 RepID=A0AA89BZA7_PINIB|nr:hypothetical protein FSP39_012871 [Pinctada imbricata]